MSKRRTAPYRPSRLTLAWTALGAVVAVLVAATFLVPPPTNVPDAVVDIPARPESYARPVAAGAEDATVFRSADLTGAGASRRSDPALGTAGSPLAEIPAAAVDEAVGSDPLPTLAETLPDGAVRITLPGAAAGPSPGSAAVSPAFAANRRQAAAVPAGTRQVAVILAGLGLDAAVTTRAIETLPPEVSFSFAPYAKDLEGLSAAARAVGHELLLELPMEGEARLQQTLGPAGLSRDRPWEANATRLDWLLSRLPRAAMATNYLGGAFSQDEAMLARVLARLKDAGLGYIDDTGLAAPVAAEVGLPHAAVAVTVPAEGGLLPRSLERLETAATAGGEVAVAKVYASFETIEALSRWSADLDRRGIALVPVSLATEATP